jgi:uncharacterized protein YtpQ (UPF0354 family)
LNVDAGALCVAVHCRNGERKRNGEEEREKEIKKGRNRYRAKTQRKQHNTNPFWKDVSVVVVISSFDSKAKTDYCCLCWEHSDETKVVYWKDQSCWNWKKTMMKMMKKRRMMRKKTMRKKKRRN